jgi:hypothetical protein
VPERDSEPDVNAAAVLALIRAENEFRSTMVGPVSPDALPLLQQRDPDDGETDGPALPDPGQPAR